MFCRNNRQRFGSGRIHLTLSTIESGRKSSDEITNNLPVCSKYIYIYIYLI